MHGVVVPCAAKRGEASKDRDGFWAVQGEAEMMGGEFGDDGEASILLATLRKAMTYE